MEQFLPDAYEAPSSPDEEVGYSLKVLKLVAQNIGDDFNGYTIVETLKSIGIPSEKINYPNTKWRTLYEIFEGALSGTIRIEHKNKKGHRAPFTGDDLISKIINEFLHPLTHNADEDKAKALAEKIKNILKYDKLTLLQEDDKYLILTKDDLENRSDNADAEMQYDWYDSEERLQKERILL